MDDSTKDSIISEIEKEYKEIDTRWMKLHYYTFAGLVICGFVIECLLGIILYRTGYIHISTERYALKYMLVPFFINASLLLTGIWAINSSGLSQKAKIYFISLLFVGTCFVFYSVHSLFASLYLIFTAPILLTVVYGDVILTTVTAFFGIGLKMISEIFIRWDPDVPGPFDSETRTADFFISIFILCGFYAVCIVVIRFEEKKTTASIRKEIERYHMQKQLITDELTEIYNRTALRTEFKKMEDDTSGTEYYLAMIDLDDFKKLNDGWGHEIGDSCLKELGRILMDNCDRDSKPFRFGGDEFCILFRDKDLDEVVAVCRRIQKDLRENAACISEISLTISVGIARHRKEMSANKLLRYTDAALYASKKTKDEIYIYEDGQDSEKDAG